MSENEKDFSELINSLSEHADENKPLRAPIWRALFYFVLTAAYIVGTMIYSGLRHDWAEVMRETGFVFEMAMSLLIWISAIIAAAWLCVPDMRGQNWLKTVPYTLISVFTLWVIIRGYTEGTHFQPFHFEHCVEHGLLVASIPLILVIFMARQGATTQPYHMAVMNGLVIASIGWLTLRLSCSMDDVGHGLFFHFLPLFVCGVIVGVFARKLFRW